jgi:hypothetical protein
MRLSRIVPALALTLAALMVGVSPPSDAVGPGGWDRLGSQIQFGNPASSLNGDVLAMTTDYAGILIAGGKFTDAGGNPNADKIAFWYGGAWNPIGVSSFNGDVMAVATWGGYIFAGGPFTDAGGNATADHLARWDGFSWQPFCNGVGGFGGNVTSLRVVGGYLYVGGEFQDGGGIPTADYLVRCDISTGVPSTTNTNAIDNFNGAVYALTSDTAGNLYAGGGFFDLENNPASDKVAMFNGTTWSNLGTGPGPGGGAVDSFVRSLADDGTSLYIGADSVNIAGIAQADHVARWNGSNWSAVGANAAGTDGYLPVSTSIDALFTSGSHVYATGNWLNVGGDPTADYFADFDGTSWKPVGSNGAGNGAFNAKGESIAMFGGVLHVGGNFTSAGGDPLARFVARFVGVPPPPSNVITLGKVKPNTANGTATLSVTVPGAGVLTLSGKGIKSQRAGAAGLRVGKPVAGAGTVKLKIKAKGKTLKQLKAHGKVTVKVTVTFTPTGGTARSETKKVKLKLRRH